MTYLKEYSYNKKGNPTKLLGLQWQGAPSKDILGEYRVRFPGGTTLGQYACLYA